MKRIIALCLALLFILCGCSQKDQVSYKTEFLEFHSNTMPDNRFTLPSGSPARISMVDKELGSNPHVIVNIYIMSDDNTQADALLYEWLNLPESSKKEDLKYVGDLYIEFAKAQGWSNNYYLYVNVFDANYGQVIYDYETMCMYTPKNDTLYKTMYEKFQTFSYREVAETEDGVDWLVAKDLGNLKHGEFDVDITKFLQGNIIITTEGEFKSKDNLTRYYDPYWD